jgi:hypothetical protein
MDEANLSRGGSCNATYSEDVINTAFGNSQTSTKENDARYINMKKLLSLQIYIDKNKNLKD